MLSTVESLFLLHKKHPAKAGHFYSSAFLGQPVVRELGGRWRSLVTWTTRIDFLDSVVQTEVTRAKHSLSSPSKHTVLSCQLLENLLRRYLRSKPRKRKHPGDLPLPLLCCHIWMPRRALTGSEMLALAKRRIGTNSEFSAVKFGPTALRLLRWYFFSLPTPLERDSRLTKGLTLRFYRRRKKGSNVLSKLRSTA